MGDAELGPTGMIVGQPDEEQVRQVVSRFTLLEALDELRGAPHVRYVEVPAHGVGDHTRPQRFEIRLARIHNCVGAAQKIMVTVKERGIAFAGRVRPPFMAGGVFPEVAHGLPVCERIVPDETRRGISQRILGVESAAAGGITARPVGEFAFHVIRSYAAVTPVVAVGALDAATIGVVQEGELADQSVLIRRDAFPENAKAGVAIAGGHVTQYLVVGAVLLDNVNDVLENTRFADALGTGCAGWSGRGGNPARASNG